MGYMSGTSLRTLEAANIFCGASGPSNHLRLADVTLPSLEEVYVDHRPGGAPVAIEIDVVLQKLRCDFTLVGWTPEVDILLNSWQVSNNQFWIFGALRDRVLQDKDKSVVQAMASIYGRLGLAKPERWQRGDLHQFQYSIRGIISYKLQVAGGVVYDFDFFNNRFLVGQTTNQPPTSTPQSQVT